MGGVTFSYTELTGDNYKLLILDDVNGEGYTFKVSPYAGYFFRDNMAAGVRLNYNRTYADIGSINLDLGDDLTFDISDYKYLEHNILLPDFYAHIWGWETVKFLAFSMSFV